MGGLPRPNVIAAGPQQPPLPQGQPAMSMAMQAAAIQEEVLDEFPVPSNVHALPRPTDISIEQKSFLAMQNAINQSSRFEHNEVLQAHGAHPSGSQDVTNMMMAALSGQSATIERDQNFALPPRGRGP